jgi:carbon-monoxide dehydrogenase medium subunit
MYAAPFEYHRPDSLAEAIALLGEFGDDGKLIAGGHSLVPLLKLRFARPQHLVDIRRLPGMAGIREERDALVIGAATTHAMVEKSSVVRAKLPVLSEAAGMIGDPAVRNMGTIGGSLAHADPNADWPALVLAFGADILVANPQGEKRLAAGEFFKGLLTTALETTDIITAIRFPLQPARTGAAYVKYPHPASRFAVCGVAALISLDEKGNVGRARVAMTGMGPVATRRTAVEDALTGGKPDPAAIRAASAHAADGLELRADPMGSEAYKANIARVFTERALLRAAEGATAPE